MVGKNDVRTSRFRGFESPSYTQVPDAVFDELLPDLSEAELKVLLYIVRRTFGFKKDADTISLRQLSSGITTREGKVLDRGTGLSKSGVTKALVTLRQRGVIVRTQNIDSVRGSMPTTYRLRVVGDPLDVEEDTPVYAGGHPLSPSVDTPVHEQSQSLSTLMDTQETVEQQTVDQDKSNIRQVPTPIFDENREAISAVIRDFARQLGDNAPLPSSSARAYNMYKHSGWEINDFIDAMYEARRVTQERSASIKKQSNERGFGTKTKLPYFFSVLENLLDS